jgi:hypothetical protein
MGITKEYDWRAWGGVRGLETYGVGNHVEGGVMVPKCPTTGSMWFFLPSGRGKRT